jgi:NAD(P)-dependent dehydrogenase (short-subunit alcohol dehydrogenase family)
MGSGEKADRVALVTGANRGIGLEVCRQLAAQGFEVVLTARDEKKGETAARKLGGLVSFQVLDVREERTIQDAVEWVRRRFGRLDCLVNNAGISKGSKGIAEADIENIKAIMETNFYGPMRVSRGFLPLLRKSADGRIINVSSEMGTLKDLTGGYAGYRLSKAGLNAQTILLANELKGSSIKVFAMSPGWVRTDMGGRLAPRSVEEGADTVVWLATTNDAQTGKSYCDRQEIPW